MIYSFRIGSLSKKGNDTPFLMDLECICRLRKYRTSIVRIEKLLERRIWLNRIRYDILLP
jgi:hypothetical protein